MSDRVGVRAWLQCMGRDAQGLLTFRFWREIDQAAFGGSGVERMRAGLECRDDYRPCRYRIELPEPVEFELGDVECDFVLAGNMAPQLALLVFALEGAGQSRFEGSFFSPELAQRAPYRLEREAAGWRSNLGELALTDSEGWLTQLRLPAPEIGIHRTRALTPRWRRSASAPPAPGHRPRCSQTNTASVDSERGSLRVAITQPSGRSARGAALFLPGSGSSDEAGMSGRVDLGYTEIADELACAGVLTVRPIRAAADGGASRLDALIADARVLWDTMPLGRPAVPRVLIGHSLGGLAALSLAASVKPSALVLLATPGRPIDEVIADQQRAVGDSMGLSAESLERERDVLAAFAAAVRDERSWRPGSVDEAILTFSPLKDWYRDLLAFNPGDAIARVECPVLIVQGDSDWQVGVGDAERLAASATAAGVEVTLWVVSQLNHLLKPITRASPFGGYSDRRRRVDRSLRARLAQWVVARALERDSPEASTS